MPIALAFVAGGLSVLNPCGFSLLPSMMMIYVRAPGGRRGAGRSLLAALVVSAGFLAVFYAVGILIILGIGTVVTVIPWLGILIGMALAVAGVLTLSGRHLGLGLRWGPRRHDWSGPRRLMGFGVAYGVSSLGCTLPVFLSVVGSSLATRGAPAALVVLGAYSAGMLLVMSALGLAAGSAGSALTMKAKAMLPHVHRVSGALLAAAGLYLTYYWARNLFGSSATLAGDPVVGPVLRFTSAMERMAVANSGVLLGTMVTAVAAALVALGVASRAWLRWLRRSLPQDRLERVDTRRSRGA